MVPFEVT